MGLFITTDIVSDFVIAFTSIGANPDSINTVIALSVSFFIFCIFNFEKMCLL